jgi:hypothetical protein
MKPSRGLELNASSSFNYGAGMLTPENSRDLNQIMFEAGLSAKVGLLMKMFVPP